MEDMEQQLPQAAGAGQAPTHQQLVKLPGFWTEDPVSWFRLAEGQFALLYVTDPVARYYHALASLSQDAVRLVRHVLHVLLQQSLHFAAGFPQPLQLPEDGEDDEAAPFGRQEAVGHAGGNARVLPSQRVIYRRFCVSVPAAPSS
jgi:hypothetical protein